MVGGAPRYGSGGAERVVAEKASRRGRLYSIRGSDSPVTGAAIRVNVAGGVRDRLSPVRRARRRLAPARKPRRRDARAPAAARRAQARQAQTPLRPIDRAFCVVVSRVWSRWADAPAIVKPATVVGWHRRGFARFWAWKSGRVGRPPLAPEVVALIVRMARENPLWSRRRIANELGPDAHVLRLIRERDAICGGAFDARVRNLGIEQLRTSPKPPWQNGYAERWIRTLRREPLEHVVVLGERHLLHLVRQHAAY
jgi:hypothetical protein